MTVGFKVFDHKNSLGALAKNHLEHTSLFCTCKKSSQPIKFRMIVKLNQLQIAKDTVYPNPRASSSNYEKQRSLFIWFILEVVKSPQIES